MLYKKGQERPEAGNILQHYIQFHEWDNTPSSYMNFVCNVIVDQDDKASINKLGSCGDEILAGININRYLFVKGGVDDTDAQRCNTHAILDLKGRYPFNETDSYSTFENEDTRSICSYARPLEASNLMSLKLMDTITYLSGFNIWPSEAAASANRAAMGESNIRHYTLTDSAVSLVASASAAYLLATL